MRSKKKPDTDATQIPDQVDSILLSFKRLGTKRTRDDMGQRYGIVGPTAENAFGVSMANMKLVAKKFAPNHQLALALWNTGNYEARMVASMVDDPALVTPAQMDRWCRDFDNWGICDTVCFKLFDQSPHAFAKVSQRTGKKPEFIKRGGFALLASIALHDKSAADKLFLDLLPLNERGAEDDRNFVKKGVSWALRSIGHRSVALRTAALKLAQQLAASSDPTPRWVGKDALEDLSRRS